MHLHEVLRIGWSDRVGAATVIGKEEFTYVHGAIIIEVMRLPEGLQSRCHQALGRLRTVRLVIAFIVTTTATAAATAIAARVTVIVTTTAVAIAVASTAVAVWALNLCFDLGKHEGRVIVLFKFHGV